MKVNFTTGCGHVISHMIMSKSTEATVPDSRLFYPVKGQWYNFKN